MTNNWIPFIIVLIADVILYLYAYKLKAISKSNSIKLIPVVVVFLTFIAYLLELDTILINVFMHVVMVIFMLLLLINVESMKVSQKKMESFYTLTVYLERERNEFSNLLHDEIIQDIKARYSGISCIPIIFAEIHRRSEERRVGKECRSRWSPYH